MMLSEYNPAYGDIQDNLKHVPVKTAVLAKNKVSNLKAQPTAEVMALGKKFLEEANRSAYNKDIDFDADGSVSLREKLAYYDERASKQYQVVSTLMGNQPNTDLRKVDLSKYGMEGYGPLQSMLQYSAYLRSNPQSNVITNLVSNISIKV